MLVSYKVLLYRVRGRPNKHHPVALIFITGINVLHRGTVLFFHLYHNSNNYNYNYNYNHYHYEMAVDNHFALGLNETKVVLLNLPIPNTLPYNHQMTSCSDMAISISLGCK